MLPQNTQTWVIPSLLVVGFGCLTYIVLYYTTQQRHRRTAEAAARRNTARKVARGTEAKELEEFVQLGRSLEWSRNQLSKARFSNPSGALVVDDLERIVKEQEKRWILKAVELNIYI